MKRDEFPRGVWPVMLTPFTDENKVDYAGLKNLTEWYIENQVSGLFAVCQSSEMFYLKDEEALKIISTVKQQAAGRVPVIASGHTAETLQQQAKQIMSVYEAGADVVVLITNRLANEKESDEIWLENLKRLLELLPKEIPLAFYECPYPYKRLLSLDNLRWIVENGRFQFLKDTCCDIEIIKKRLDITVGKTLKLYNANTTTLLESLKYGAAGFSGVMANFHPELYVWLCSNFENESAVSVSDILTAASLIERQCYPVNAKYHLAQNQKVKLSLNSRVKDCRELTETFKKEVDALNRVILTYENEFLKTN